MPVVIEGVPSFMHICIMVFIMILYQRSKINIVSFFKREIILQKCKSFHNYDQCVSSSRSNSISILIKTIRKFSNMIGHHLVMRLCVV